VRGISAVGAVGVVTAAVVVGTSAGGGPGTPSTAREGDTATAPVARRTLRVREVVTGTFGFGDASSVTHRTAGPPGGGTLTAVAPTGRTVRRGGVLYRVDQRPVRLLYGTVPMWRTLARGVHGRDVRQLQRNLIALGHGGGADDGRFGAATAEAVRRWQRATGRPPSGRVVLGAVVFAAGPRRVAATPVALGAPVPEGTVVLRTTATERGVLVPLDADKQALARVGAPVDVTLPTQRVLRGTIASVGPVTAPQGDDDGNPDAPDDAKDAPDASLEVRVRLRSLRGTGRLSEAPVSVALTRELRRRVLSVPVTALAAGRGDGYAVRVVRGGRTVAVPVRVGLFAGGFAEVRARGLRAGDRVRVPRVA
jgi:peptidoglycan hydrolase-like protein with peptidoglycan-binding domain